MMCRFIFVHIPRKMLDIFYIFVGNCEQLVIHCAEKIAIRYI